MPLNILSFLLGNLSLQQLATFPSLAWLLFFATIISLLLFFFKKNFYSLLIIFYFLGLSWSMIYVYLYNPGHLPNELENQSLTITGKIATIPHHQPSQTSFLFLSGENDLQPLSNKLLQINWRQPPSNLTVGDNWQLTVKLKKVRGLANPGGFDYEAWAFQQGIYATGYVVPQGVYQHLSTNFYQHPIDRIRQALQTKIENILPPSVTSPWITALVMGERNNIPAEYWEVLRNTGTNHLMAIAGLHIGLMSGLAFITATWLWRRSTRLLLFIPATQIGAVAALLMTIFYSAMAGFSIPTQRALFMMIIFQCAILAKRKLPAWHAWSLAMFLVLLHNPLNILTESFWLSFGTIALIIYGMSGRLSTQGWWWKWGRTQWVIGLGLIPLSFLLFQQCSLISFIANTIAIPWLGFLILPFCFLGSVVIWISPGLAKILLCLADKSLAYLWQILSWLAKQEFSVWTEVPPGWMLVAATIGILILLLPRGFPGKLFGGIACLPCIFYQPQTPSLGNVKISLLDVGQGLSVVVQTQHHVLVYDTGPHMGNMDAGENVVIPFLRAEGIKKLDMLVVSHGDNDHSGGAAAIIKQFPIRYLRTSVPHLFPSTKTAFCLRGAEWMWDKVHFTFLYPSRTELNLGNDSSCVLQITAGKHRVLLPGDIEKNAENILLAQDKSKLNSEILIAPHHGSKTSGVDEFVRAVNPVYVLYAIGYHNRFHFPHPTIVQQYTLLTSTQLNTVDAGTIQFLLRPGLAIAPPSLYKIKRRRYWQ